MSKGGKGKMLGKGKAVKGMPMKCKEPMSANMPMMQGMPSTSKGK